MSTTIRILPPTYLAAALALTGCYDAGDVWPESPDELLATYEGALTNTAMPGELDGYNDPRAVEPDYEMRFDALPEAGSLSFLPWTDTYWPKNEGGISNRWATGEHTDYRELAPDEVAAITPLELKNLSPSEKYDLYVGNPDFSLTVREKARNLPTEASWQGYCHGWAPAALMYEEPKPVTVPAPDGRGIPFGSADIKALLSYFQGEVVQTTYSTESLPWARYARGVGSMCASGRADNPSCYDLNPGALHVLLANEIALRDRGFVLEVDEGVEKWNQPVHSYETRLLERRAPSSGAAEDAVAEVRLRVDVHWTVEIEPMWSARGDLAPSNTGTYFYTVELDAAGEVVGGQWLIPRGDGRYWTMGEAWDLLMNWDSDDEGDSPDLTRDEASDILFRWLEKPDFAWVLDESDFPSEFQPTTSAYTLLGGGLTLRRSLHAYFAPLADLYARSIE